MEIDTTQTQITSIRPERIPEEDVTPVPDTTETVRENTPAATPAFEVTISEEARVAAETELQAEEARNTSVQSGEPEVVQVYNNTGQIGG